ncbi:hypothetical protein PGT21_018859 [Puccinia graminis f. sp. tritici]|uniref:Uncharacterized protein n=1 Tax=Puccinia graminis f. sp. tritici TaxID=56615 RepID=A0A5B0QBK6_PUCGR|nr:hypothetical protein PGT21_018859 [Puccinia graminis f. sp. tritici]
MLSATHESVMYSVAIGYSRGAPAVQAIRDALLTSSNRCASTGYSCVAGIEGALYTTRALFALPGCQGDVKQKSMGRADRAAQVCASHRHWPERSARLMRFGQAVGLVGMVNRFHTGGCGQPTDL